MNELMDLVRRAVREELALRRGPQLATVTALAALWSTMAIMPTPRFQVPSASVRSSPPQSASTPAAAPHPLVRISTKPNVRCEWKPCTSSS